MKEIFDNYLETSFIYFKQADFRFRQIEYNYKKNFPNNKNSNKFDLITLCDVLEHFKKEDIITFLKSLKNALKKNGKLIIQVPNSQSPESYLHRYNDITHEVIFSEHSLRQVLISAEFKKIEFFGFEDFVTNNIKEVIARFLRNIYWKKIRLERRINCNLKPKILNPVMFVGIENE